MPKFNEKEILRRLKLLSQFEPTSKAAERAAEKVRQRLTSRQTGQESLNTRIWRTIFRSPITKIAAAAVIVIGVGFFMFHLSPDEQVDTGNVAEVAKSPAEMLTVGSLNIAYRQGGIEAVENQCEKAVKLLGPRPRSLTIQQLLAEFNGT